MAGLDSGWGLAVEASAPFLLLVEIVACSPTRIPGRVWSGAAGRGMVSQLVDEGPSKSVVERVAVESSAASTTESTLVSDRAVVQAPLREYSIRLHQAQDGPRNAVSDVPREAVANQRTLAQGPT